MPGDTQDLGQLLADLNTRQRQISDSRNRGLTKFVNNNETVTFSESWWSRTGFVYGPAGVGRTVLRAETSGASSGYVFS